MAKVENYTLYSRDGKRIREATQVTFTDKPAIKFLDKLSKKEALKQAKRYT